MVEILKIKAGEEPSPYTNYVLVEQTNASSFRASGISNEGGAPDYFAPPQTRDLEAMLKVAVAWAYERGIHIVHVKMRMSH